MLVPCELIFNLVAVNSEGQEAFLGRQQEVVPFPLKDEIALRQDGL